MSATPCGLTIEQVQEAKRRADEFDSSPVAMARLAHMRCSAISISVEELKRRWGPTFASMLMSDPRTRERAHEW